MTQIHPNSQSLKDLILFHVEQYEEGEERLVIYGPIRDDEYRHISVWLQCSICDIELVGVVPCGPMDRIDFLPCPECLENSVHPVDPEEAHRTAFGGRASLWLH